jgi:F0F1-type ATP synthase assembly protein I
MNDKSDWLDGIRRQVDLLRDTLSERDYRKFKLRLLICFAERVAEFCGECGECQVFQKDISALVQDMGNLVQLADKERQKSYFKSMDKIANHLQKQHKLVNAGYYMIIGIVIGSGIGVALGAAMDHVAFGIPIGVGIGLAIGAALDAKAMKEGRTLCPR